MQYQVRVVDVRLLQCADARTNDELQKFGRVYFDVPVPTQVIQVQQALMTSALGVLGASWHSIGAWYDKKGHLTISAAA